MIKDKIGDVFFDEIKDNIYSNRTRKYLTPILKNYGEEFIRKLNVTHKVAIGVSDKILLKSNLHYDNHLFIMFNTNKRTKVFESFLEYIKDFEYYTQDYIFGNILKSPYHIVVLRIPDKFTNTLDNFKIGNYSLLYDKQTICNYFPLNSNIYKVLIKSKSALPILIETINKEFNVNFKKKDFTNKDVKEYDIPPIIEEEIFNNHLK